MNANLLVSFPSNPRASARVNLRESDASPAASTRTSSNRTRVEGAPAFRRAPSTMPPDATAGEAFQSLSVASRIVLPSNATAIRRPFAVTVTLCQALSLMVTGDWASGLASSVCVPADALCSAVMRLEKPTV